MKRIIGILLIVVCTLAQELYSSQKSQSMLQDVKSASELLQGPRRVAWAQALRYAVVDDCVNSVAQELNNSQQSQHKFVSIQIKQDAMSISRPALHHLHLAPSNDNLDQKASLELPSVEPLNKQGSEQHQNTPRRSTSNKENKPQDDLEEYTRIGSGALEPRDNKKRLVIFTKKQSHSAELPNSGKKESVEYQEDNVVTKLEEMYQQKISLLQQYFLDELISPNIQLVKGAQQKGITTILLIQQLFQLRYNSISKEAKESFERIKNNPGFILKTNLEIKSCQTAWKELLVEYELYTKNLNPACCSMQ
jgi:hypothetical protein